MTRPRRTQHTRRDSSYRDTEQVRKKAGRDREHCERRDRADRQERRAGRTGIRKQKSGTELQSVQEKASSQAACRHGQPDSVGPHYTLPRTHDRHTSMASNPTATEPETDEKDLRGHRTALAVCTRSRQPYRDGVRGNYRSIRSTAEGRVLQPQLRSSCHVNR